ncbi:MAG: hypothetical protein WCZ66_09235 [Sphingomonadaceae bacterium]
MSLPQIHKKSPPFSASDALEVIGSSLSRIKFRTGLSDARLADPLGKSPDRLRDYRDANSEMGVTTFLRGVQEWGVEFANPALALAGYRLVACRDAETCDTAKAVKLSSALTAVLKAAADGVIDDTELRAMRPEIEAAGRAIDELRERMARAA